MAIGRLSLAWACVAVSAAVWAAPATRPPPYRALVHAQNMARLGCAMPDTTNRFVGSAAPGQVFLPGETAAVTLAFLPALTNRGPLDLAIELQEIVQRAPDRADALVSGLDDFGPPDLVAPVGAPVRRAIATPAFANRGESLLHVSGVPLPARYGTYALILCKRRRGAAADTERCFLGTLARVPLPNPRATVDSTFILGEGQFFAGQARDTQAQRLARGATYARMGVRGMRCELGWHPRPDGSYDWAACDALFAAAETNGIRILVTLGGAGSAAWPFAPHQTPAAVAPGWDGNPYSGRADWTSDPRRDADYAAWITAFCSRYWKDGRGALWGIEHYNEPWEGGGISGWAADIPRYRALLRLIREAAHAVSPGIRIFAASSVMNTEDKLYSDGGAACDGLVDVFTDHYVRPPLSYGPQVAAARGKLSMDTESWVVNSEYRLPMGAAVFAACGQRHVNPWHPRALFDSLPGSRERYLIPTPTVVATAAFNALTSGRAFRRIVFHDRLPWLFQFGDDRASDGLLVLFGQLVNVGAGSPADNPKERPLSQVDGTDGGTIEIDNRDGLLTLLDLAGNPLPDTRRRLVLPLTFLPTYIQCRKGPAAAAARLSAATIRGKRPVEIVPLDFDAPVGTPGLHLRVKVHNCLPQPVNGTLTVEPPPGFVLATNAVRLALAGGATSTASLAVASAQPDPANAYPFAFAFAGPDGDARYVETLNAAVARRYTPTIDGRLEEWAGLPGITRVARTERADPGELARLPWLARTDRLPDGTFAELKLAWDADCLYVAARVHDPTVETNKLRRATWRQDDWFHSADSDRREPYEAWLMEKKGADGRTLRDAGRSFAEVSHVYRRSPRPALAFSGDQLQLAFDVRDGWHDLAPPTNAVPTGFTAVPDTDYEFALYRCEDGGSELWRLLAPGMPRMHGYPRQPLPTAGPRPDAVAGARHVVRQEGAVRVYEAAIPRAEIPELALRPGSAFGFLFHVGNNSGPAVTYADDKAVAKLNGLSLHPYWLPSASCSVRWTLVE